MKVSIVDTLATFVLFFRAVSTWNSSRINKTGTGENLAKNHDNPVSPATVNREVILLKSMLKKAAEWYELTLRTIALDLAKEESRERILSRSEMGLLVATNIKARQWKFLQYRKTDRTSLN